MIKQEIVDTFPSFKIIHEYKEKDKVIFDMITGLGEQLYLYIDLIGSSNPKNKFTVYYCNSNPKKKRLNIVKVLKICLQSLNRFNLSLNLPLLDKRNLISY